MIGKPSKKRSQIWAAAILGAVLLLAGRASAVHTSKCPESFLLIGKYLDYQEYVTIHGLYGESTKNVSDLPGFQRLDEQDLEMAVRAFKTQFKRGICSYKIGERGTAIIKGTDKQPYLAIELEDISIQGGLTSYSKTKGMEFKYHGVYSRVDAADFLDRVQFGEFMYTELLVL